MRFSGTDLYTLLEVSNTASLDEIKKAYKQQAFLHHPDKHGSQQLFLEITRAYEILSNPQKKAEYDHAEKPKIDSFEYTSQGTVKIKKEALDRLINLIDNRLQEMK